MAIRKHDESASRPSRAGSLLVASPHFGGAPLARTVVLLLEDRRQGGLGAILDERFREGMSAIQERGESRSRGESPFTSGAPIRLGLKAWGPGQLDQELARGLWLNVPFIPETVFGGGDLWVELVRAAGRLVLRDALRIETHHVNPLLN